MKEYGQYLFWIGVVLAVVAPFVQQYMAMIALAELVIGILIGVLNLESKEETSFLIAAIAFMATVGTFTMLLQNMAGQAVLAGLVTWLSGALTTFGWMVAPAAIIVATKQLVDFMRA